MHVQRTTIADRLARRIAQLGLALCGAAFLLPVASPRLIAEEPAVSPPSNLVVDGIPAIPKSLEQRVQAYTESRGAAVLDWQHGSQTRISFIGSSSRAAHGSRSHSSPNPWAVRRSSQKTAVGSFWGVTLGETSFPNFIGWTSIPVMWPC